MRIRTEAFLPTTLALAFTLLAPDGIRVWEPVTTWWHGSAEAADAALEEHTD